MIWSKYRHIFVAFALATAASITLVVVTSLDLWQLRAGDQGTARSSLVSSLSTQDERRAEPVVWQTYYTMCQHTRERPPLPELQDATDFAALQAGLASQRGWQVVRKENGTILVTEEIDALCPEDAEKRHLGSFGEYVAVIKGPVGINGGLVTVTDVLISSLPPPWQEQVRNGTLDFPTVEAMRQALDSLDEFMR